MRISRVARVVATSSAIGLSAVTLASVPSAAAPSPITGTVFRDLNHDGVNDAAEPGWPGVTVTAQAPDGSILNASTGSDGSYSIAGTDDAATYRVTFGWAEQWLSAGPVGPDSGSSTQFVSGGAIAGFSVATAGDYCVSSDDALGYATTCFTNGDPLTAGSVYAGNDAIISAPGTSSGAAGSGGTPDHPDILADNAVLGSTYGLAWQASSGRLFSAAFLKRHVGLGLGGIDAIYSIDGGTSAVWYSAIDAGTVADNQSRGLPIAADPTSLDADAFGSIYKVGWGDIDLSPDESTLYAANLSDRNIYAIDVAAADSGSTAAHQSIGRPPATCNGGVDRVFALEIHDGTLWAGVTCTAETSGSPADLSAAVFGYDIAAGTWATTPGISFDLNYAKGCSVFAQGCQFNPWLDVYSDAAFGLTPDNSPFEAPRRPQPMLSDLEVDADGSLILAIRDRQGDQFGHRNLSPADDGNLITGATGGDLLRATPGGSAGTWVLESNGVVGSLTSGGSGLQNEGQGGQNSNQGPGGGEFYADEFVVSGGQNWHSETVLGSLALAPGRPSVAATLFDPIDERLDAAGIAWFSNTNGLTQNKYELYRDGGTPAPVTFGKANGLGDLEALCPPAPVQIGNRVWFDANNDGIQDPGEPPIPGVKVTIGGVTVVTDAAGQWSLTVAPHSQSEVSFDVSMADVSGIDGVSDPSELSPAPKDNGDDLNDSDMDPQTLTITAQAQGPGQNDHTFDAGFSASPATVEIGNLVWLDANNNGVAEANEAGIAGVLVELWIDESGDGNKDTKLADTTTDGDGHYAFSGLTVRTYFINIPAQYASDQPLAGLASSTPSNPNPDDDGDNDDNGVGPQSASGGVMSGAVVLTTTGEPNNEVVRTGQTERDASPSGTPDGASNLSVDFGFYPTASLGNYVWIDEDGDGVQDPGEKPVPGVTVHLCDANMAPIASTVTDADGHYLFTGLAPGEYMVCFDLTTVPNGFKPTTANAGADDAIDSDADPLTGKTPGVVLGPGDQNLTLDLGLIAAPTSPTPNVPVNTGDTGGLARTGNDSLAMVWMASLLVAVGAALLMLRKVTYNWAPGN